jgi:hypothetical protein
MTVYTIASEMDSFEMLVPGYNINGGGPPGSRTTTRLSSGGKAILRTPDINEAWFHLIFASANFLNSGANVIYIKNTVSGKNQFRLISGGNSVTIAVAWSANGSVYNNLGSFVFFSVAGFVTLDLHFKTGASGFFEAFTDGTRACLFTGSYVTDDVAFNGIELTGAGNMDVAQLIVADESTLGWTLNTIAPSAAGASSAWGGLFSDVNEIGLTNFLNFASTNTIGALTTYTITDMVTFAATTREIKDVWYNCSADKTAGSTVTDFAPVIRTGGTNYIGPTFGILPVAGSVNFKKNYTLAPSGVAWTEALVNAMEAGYIAS